MYDLEDYKLENLEVNDKMVYEKIINSDLKKFTRYYR